MVSSEEMQALYDEGNSEKLIRKAKENPLMPLGIFGFVAMVSTGLYGIRKRGNLPISLYLIHLRVKAQAMVAGAAGIGVGYKLLKDHVFYPKNEHEEKTAN